MARNVSATRPAGIFTVAIDLVIVACAVSFLWQGYFYQPEPRLRPASRTVTEPVRPGTTLRIPGINWTDATGHIVLGFVTTCSYCQASAPFYNRLSQWIDARADYRLVVLSPQPEATIEQWMRERGIRNFTPVRENFALRGFTATPSIAIVDNRGAITDVVFGQLTQAEETQFIARLDGHLHTPLAIRIPAWTASASNIAR